MLNNLSTGIVQILIKIIGFVRLIDLLKKAKGMQGLVELKEKRVTTLCRNSLIINVTSIGQNSNFLNDLNHLKNLEFKPVLKPPKS